MQMNDLDIILTGPNGLIAVSPVGRVRLYPYSVFLSRAQIDNIRMIHKMLKADIQEVKRVTGFDNIFSYVESMYRQIQNEAEGVTVFMHESG